MLETFLSRAGIYTVAKFVYKGCYKIITQDLNGCKSKLIKYAVKPGESISWLTVPENDYFSLIHDACSINYKGRG